MSCFEVINIILPGDLSSQTVWCDVVGGRREGKSSNTLVICEPEPEFRRFGAEADDVSEGGGRVVGLGFAATVCIACFQGG